MQKDRQSNFLHQQRAGSVFLRFRLFVGADQKYPNHIFYRDFTDALPQIDVAFTMLLYTESKIKDI